MEVIVFYSLMLQRYISLKQKILKEKQYIFQQICEKSRIKWLCTIFLLLITGLLILVILSISISI